MASMVTLRPGVWTRIPGTRCEIRWDGEDEVTVYNHRGIWDLSPTARHGRVMAWVRINRDGRPVTSAWPVVALSGSRTRTYPGRDATPGRAGDVSPGRTGPDHDRVDPDRW